MDRMPGFAELELQQQCESDGDSVVRYLFAGTDAQILVELPMVVKVMTSWEVEMLDSRFSDKLATTSCCCLRSTILPVGVLSFSSDNDTAPPLFGFAVAQQSSHCSSSSSKVSTVAFRNKAVLVVHRSFGCLC